MIQEIAPHQYDNTYRPQKPEAEDYVLYYVTMMEEKCL